MVKVLRYIGQWMALILLFPLTLPLYLAAFYCFYRDETRRKQIQEHSA